MSDSVGAEIAALVAEKIAEVETGAEDRPLSADDIISALKGARSLHPYRLVLNGKYVGTLNLRAVSFQDMYRARSAAADQMRNPKKAEGQIESDLIWIYYGVVKEDGSPFFTTAEVRQLRDADYAEVNKLMGAIQALSGAPIDLPDFPELYGGLYEASVDEIMGYFDTLDGIMENSDGVDWPTLKANLRDIVVSAVKQIISTGATVAVQHLQLGGLADSVATDEDLGNGSTQTP